MNVPTLYLLQKVITPDGFFTPSMKIYFEQMNSQLQDNFSEDGLVVPKLTTAEILQVASLNNVNTKPNGTLWYDTTTNELKVKINSVVKVINTT